MRRRRFLAMACACGVFVALVVGFLRETPPTIPPNVVMVRSDPSEIVDDTGSELQLITVRITNPMAPLPPYDPRHGLYLLVEEHFPGTNVPKAWLPQRAGPNGTTQPDPVTLAPGTFWEVTILAPSPRNHARFRLRYAGPSWGMVSRLAVLRWMQRLLPQRFFGTFNQAYWKWVGIPPVHHRLPWNEAEWDLDLTDVESGSTMSSGPKSHDPD